MVWNDSDPPLVRFDRPGTVTKLGPLGLLDEPTAGERTELKSSSGPVGRLVFMLIFAVFWNGIISIFVVEAVRAWMGKGPALFLSLFLIPFVVIGLVLIGLVIRQALALMNPRPAVTVSSARVPIGGTIDIDWSLRGRMGRVRELTMTLEGREEAVYTRGTDTHTDREAFLTIPLGTWSGRECEQGTLQLTIPEGSMHSFAGHRNRVLWHLQLKCDIPKWPDIEEEYPLFVVPAD